MNTLLDPLPHDDHVAVLGLGVAGRAACRLLRRLGKTVRATDARTRIDRAGLPEGIEVALGTNDPADARVAILSPGLNPSWPENRDNPALRPLWERAERGELRLMSELEFGARAFPGRILAVGGTDGKSTTAALLAHLLRELGVPTLLGGNSWDAISDVVLRHATSGETATCAVVEVSAFQLWSGHRLAPDVAILTNIARDHLDHFETFEDYVAAKRELVRHAGPTMTVVLNSEDERLMGWADSLRSTGATVRSFGVRGDLVVSDDALCWAEPHTLPAVPLDGFTLPGAHNRRNLAAAFLAVDALSALDIGLPGTATAGQLRAAAASFHGLPHRIEFVGAIDGVRFFNDSKATNVHAACVALDAMERPVVAIVGGVDKNLDLAPLIASLKENARAVVVLGELQQRFSREAAPSTLDVVRATSLEDAVDKAHALAGDSCDVLFSPACSSFDMFRSFEHRGDEFRKLIGALAGSG